MGEAVVAQTRVPVDLLAVNAIAPPTIPAMATERSMNVAFFITKTFNGCMFLQITEEKADVFKYMVHRRRELDYFGRKSNC